MSNWSFENPPSIQCSIFIILDIWSNATLTAYGIFGKMTRPCRWSLADTMNVNLEVPLHNLSIPKEKRSCRSLIQPRQLCKFYGLFATNRRALDYTMNICRPPQKKSTKFVKGDNPQKSWNSYHTRNEASWSTIKFTFEDCILVSSKSKMGLCYLSPIEKRNLNTRILVEPSLRQWRWPLRCVRLKSNAWFLGLLIRRSV